MSRCVGVSVGASLAADTSITLPNDAPPSAVSRRRIANRYVISWPSAPVSEFTVYGVMTPVWCLLVDVPVFVVYMYQYLGLTFGCYVLRYRWS